MKYHITFSNRLACDNEEDVFQFLIRELKNSITTWDYFVNWEKVVRNFSEIEDELHLLNVLVGADNAELRLQRLIEKYPRTLIVLPILIACRPDTFDIITDASDPHLKYAHFDFRETSHVSEAEARKAANFAAESGVLQLITDKRIRSIPDYVLGVEVGLDSNGRKNRGGTLMETLVEDRLRVICAHNGWPYLAQATSRKLLQEWGVKLPVERSSRAVDFAVNVGGRVCLIETNFYGGGGSKLKSTAGEYTTMHRHWTAAGFPFFWITDGLGWKSTAKPLRETFDATDYILNLEMVSRGVLEDLLKIEAMGH